MSRISEQMTLLGLIIKTKPFQYSNNIVTCSFEGYVEIEDLENTKTDLEQQLKDLSEEAKTDENIRAFNDDLYFIEYVIQELKKVT